MSSVRRLRSADYRVMPWKNGLGTTTEIAVDPPGAGLDDFTFRVSIADLLASGPFSTFPGIDRVLVQIEGEPMTLSHEGGAPQRLSLLVPHRFAGEVATHGEIAGPARDFNVMVRRERARAEVVTRVLPAGGAASASGATCLAYVLRGAMRAEGEAEVIAEGETAIAEGALSITAGAEGATVIVVTVTR